MAYEFCGAQSLDNILVRPPENPDTQLMLPSSPINDDIVNVTVLHVVLSNNS